MNARNLTEGQAAALAEIRSLISGHGIQPHELQFLSQQERKAAILQIHKLMVAWNIESWELTGFGRREIPTVAGVAAHKPKRLHAKYRHPVTGEEWSGQGSQPEWLKAALITEGMTVEQLRV